jgi:S1-C subfamily serine protease
MKVNMSWSKGKAAVAAAVGLIGSLVFVAAPMAQSTTRAPMVKRDLRVLLGGPELGVSIRDVTEADVKTEKLSTQAGAYVENVRADSPAAAAGLRAGDIVVTFDGERVRGASHLSRLVDETPAGRPVEIVLQRAGSRTTVSATLRENQVSGPRILSAPDVRAELLQPFELKQFEQFAPGLRATAGRLGVSVETMSDQLRSYFGAEHGVLVTSVEAGTPAAAAGLKAGDVITNAGSTVVRTTADLRQAVAAASGDVALSIVRDKKTMTVIVRFPARGGPSGPTI